jgi:hypothetical protein
MNIYEKLNKIQTELKAPKGQMNKFGNYRYRSCEDIMEAVKPLLAETKTILVISDDIVQVGDRIYVMAKVTFTDGEGTITNQAYAREEESKKGMDSSQVTGASSSYARKCALNGLFAIDDSKDADTDEHVNATKPAVKSAPVKARTITPTEAEVLVTLAAKKGSDISKLMAYYEVTELDKMTIGQFNQAMLALEKKADA